MKRIFLLGVPLILEACVSKGVPPISDIMNPPAVKESVALISESAFQESSGTLTLAFDAKGNWLKLVAKGTAEIGSQNSAARDSALMIATMRAKRTVAEFLSSDLKSSKTLHSLAKSYAKSFSSVGNPKTQSGDSEALPDDAVADNPSTQAEDFAQSLTERIKENSAAIIRGGYVSYRALEEGRAIVELTVTRESIGITRQISRMMSGGMQ